MIKDHVLLRFSGSLEAADSKLTALITTDSIEDIVKLIPDEWLAGDSSFAGITQNREAYTDYLRMRLASPHEFVEEAIRARAMYL